MSNMQIPNSIDKVCKYLTKQISSDDVKLHQFSCENKNFLLFYIDCLTDKNALSLNVLKPLKTLCKFDFESVSKTLNAPEMKVLTTLPETLTNCFDGNAILFIEGESKAISLGYKKYPMRAVQEPPTSITLRGPREGFVECLNTNLSLVRRRVKSTKLKIEFLTVGEYSQTKIALCYVDGVAKDGLREQILEKLNTLSIDNIPDSSYIAKHLTKDKTSIFKEIGTTEKPDVFCAKIMEGRIGLIVDGSPFVLTMPYVLLEDFQAPDDYYSLSYRSTAVRILRIFSVMVAILLPGLFVSAELFHLQLLPLSFLLTIVNSIKGIPLSPSFEMFFTLTIFEILNEASIRMPKYVGMAVSIVGGLVLGETAVTAGIISAPTLMIVAVSGICLYTVPEMVQTFSVLRLLFLLSAGSFGGYGMILVGVGVVIYLVSAESFGTPILAPFAPLIIKDHKDAIYKGFFAENTFRPKTFGSKNKTRIKIFKTKTKNKEENQL